MESTEYRPKRLGALTEHRIYPRIRQDKLPKQGVVVRERGAPVPPLASASTSKPPASLSPKSSAPPISRWLLAIGVLVLLVALHWDWDLGAFGNVCTRDGCSWDKLLPLPDWPPESWASHTEQVGLALDALKEACAAFYKAAVDSIRGNIRDWPLWSTISDSVPNLALWDAADWQKLIAWRPSWVPCLTCSSCPLSVFSKRLPDSRVWIGGGTVLLLLLCLPRSKLDYQTVTPLPGLGLQLATVSTLTIMGRPVHTWTKRRFVPRGAIQSVVIHEALRRWNVVYYLGIVTDDEVVVPFEDVRPQLEALVEVYHAVQSEVLT